MGTPFGNIVDQAKRDIKKQQSTSSGSGSAPVAQTSTQSVPQGTGAFAPQPVQYTPEQHQQFLPVVIDQGVVPPKTVQTVARTGVFLPKETPEGFKQSYGVPKEVYSAGIGPKGDDLFYRYAYESMMGVDTSRTGSASRLTGELSKSRHWWDTYARFEDDKTWEQVKEEYPYLYLTRDTETGVFKPEESFTRFQQEQVTSYDKRLKDKLGNFWGGYISGQLTGAKAFGAVVLKAPFLKPSFWMDKDKGEWIARSEYGMQKKIWSGNVKGYVLEDVLPSPLMTNIVYPLAGGYVFGKALGAAGNVASGTTKLTGWGAKAVTKAIPIFAKGAAVTLGGTFVVGTGVDLGLTAARQGTGDWVKDWTSPEVLDKAASIGMQFGFGYAGYKAGYGSSIKGNVGNIRSKTTIVVNPENPSELVFVSRSGGKIKTVSIGKINFSNKTAFTKGISFRKSIFGNIKSKSFVGKSYGDYITDMDGLSFSAGGGRVVPVKSSLFSRFGFKGIKKNVTDIFGYSLQKDIYAGDTFIKGGFLESYPEDISFLISSGRGINRFGKFFFKDTARIIKPSLKGGDYFGESMGFDYRDLVSGFKDVLVMPSSVSTGAKIGFPKLITPMGRWTDLMFSRKRSSIEDLDLGIISSGYWDSSKPRMDTVFGVQSNMFTSGIKTGEVAGYKFSSIQGLKPLSDTVTSQGLKSGSLSISSTLPLSAQIELSAQLSVQSQVSLQSSVSLQSQLSLSQSMFTNVIKTPYPLFLGLPSGGTKNKKRYDFVDFDIGYRFRKYKVPSLKDFFGGW